MATLDFQEMHDDYARNHDQQPLDVRRQRLVRSNGIIVDGPYEEIPGDPDSLICHYNGSGAVDGIATTRREKKKNEHGSIIFLREQGGLQYVAEDLPVISDGQDPILTPLGKWTLLSYNHTTPEENGPGIASWRQLFHLYGDSPWEIDPNRPIGRAQEMQKCNRLIDWGDGYLGAQGRLQGLDPECSEHTVLTYREFKDITDISWAFATADRIPETFAKQQWGGFGSYRRLTPRYAYGTGHGACRTKRGKHYCGIEAIFDRDTAEVVEAKMIIDPCDYFSCETKLNCLLGVAYLTDATPHNGCPYVFDYRGGFNDLWDMQIIGRYSALAHKYYLKGTHS